MTSANVTYYEIYDTDMNLIDTARQHALCKDRITAKLEEWEKEYPDAILCLRWPNEHEIDEYLVFEEYEGYTEGVLEGVFYEEEREMILLRSYMKRKRIYKIKSLEGLLESVRKINKKLRDSIVVYCREELGNMNVENDKECIDYFLEFGKEDK